MNNNATAINELRNLMRANYERMIAFEQAAFHVKEEKLKNYFEQKAEESEMNIAELNEVFSSLCGEKFEVEETSGQEMLHTTHLFTNQKNINVLLKNIVFLEKTIMNWYKSGIKNLKGVSKGLNLILDKHSVGLQASHVFVKSC